MKLIINLLSLISLACAYSSQGGMMNKPPMMGTYQKQPMNQPMNMNQPKSFVSYQPTSYDQSKYGKGPVSNDFISQTKSMSNICAGKPVNERFAHETNEAMYIECGFDGQKFERICPPKTKYVAEYGQCTLGFPLTKPCERVEHACKNGGVCENVNDNEYMCKCKPGFSGLDCATNIDDCASQPCGSDVCVDLIGGHICLRKLADETTLIGESPNSLYKSECQITEEPNQFFRTQFNTAFFYQCTPQGVPVPKSCHVGYHFHLNERACLDKPIDMECVALGCNMNQDCVKDPIARCECKEGFTGEWCQTKIDYCEKNPCKNGGICTSYSTGYSCLCPNNFYDDDCSNVGNINNPCRINEMANGILIYPHPNDITKFVSCFAYEAAAVLSCPPGLRFDREVRTCLSDDYQNAIATVLEQQKYQESLPKTWKPSADPLRVPSVASGSAKVVPYDSNKKTFGQIKEEKVFVQKVMPEKMIEPIRPVQIIQPIPSLKPLGPTQVFQPIQSINSFQQQKPVLQMSQPQWAKPQNMNMQKPVAVPSYQTQPKQQSSWSASSYQSSNFVQQQKPQAMVQPLMNSAPTKFNGGY